MLESFEEGGRVGNSREGDRVGKLWRGWSCWKAL